MTNEQNPHPDLCKDGTSQGPNCGLGMGRERGTGQRQSSLPGIGDMNWKSSKISQKGEEGAGSKQKKLDVHNKLSGNININRIVICTKYVFVYKGILI